jgi:hypothetical protein
MCSVLGIHQICILFITCNLKSEKKSWACCPLHPRKHGVEWSQITLLASICVKKPIVEILLMCFLDQSECVSMHGHL